MPTKLLILSNNSSSSSDYLPVSTASSSRLQPVRTHFEQAYHHLPQYVARAPGRVNIIGEHIDYNGFGVLPMALEQSVFVACSSKPHEQKVEEDPAATLQIRSTSPGAEPRQYTYHLSEIVEQFSNKQQQQQDEITPPFDSSDRDWSHYVLCAFFGVLEELCTTTTTSWNPPPSSATFSLLVHGTVPQGAGVSSSSALVVSSALAFLALFHHHPTLVPRSVIALLCARCERWVGTEGGGMDQAISIFAQANQARYIQFQPTLVHQAIPLPAGTTSWVVCHSLEESHKRHDAATLFNKRVVECKIAGWWLAKLLGSTTSTTTNSDRYPVLIWELVRQSDQSLEALEAMAQEKVPVDCSKTELLEWVLGKDATPSDTILKQLAVKLGITRPAGVQVLEVAEAFCVRDRLLHVLSETRRVQQFVALCQGESHPELAIALGRLMNQSHQSCSEWYDCSSAQVDRLQKVCREAPGAVGSRMTGAGWGGCVISLVYTPQVEDFCNHVREGYYATLAAHELAGKQEVDYMFVTKPSQGSELFDLDAV